MQAGKSISSAAAPLRGEHVEKGASNGERIHLRWIPVTDETSYITRGSSLNLASEPLGPGGDWHSAGWWVPCQHEGERIHFAKMSTDERWWDATKEIQDVLGTEQLADAREALDFLGHPAARRDQPVWCATHVRAVLEKAWGWMRDSERELAGTTLQCVEPTAVARWLATREQWVKLHELATRIGQEIAPRWGLQKSWQDWQVRQSPIAHFTTPEVRWNLKELDKMSALGAREAT